MLQQTQVNTVLSYYERWMKKFPTLARLARAPLSSVLKAWEGLGYYRRARNLHHAAKRVTKKFAGKFPETPEELLKLPGIGRYTAGAVASIAFGKAEPVLDGNVKRVLARIFALKEAVDTSPGEKKLWELAKKLVPKSNPGDFNQALMELGALVCLPENPKCPVCPVEKLCQAHRLGQEIRFPIKERREKQERLNTVAAVLWKKGRVLLQRQPLKNRWGGLWIFPQWIHRNGELAKSFLQKRIRMELKTTVEALKPRMEIEHGFTKYRVRLRVYEGNCGRSSASPRHVWIEPKKLFRLPLPSPHQKIAEAIQKNA